MTSRSARNDAISNVILCLAIFVAGIIVGWRLNYLRDEYGVSKIPICAEDEWVSAETGECVHIDTIVNEALEERGMQEVPK